jgi:hypothetical protein
MRLYDTSNFVLNQTLTDYNFKGRLPDSMLDIELSFLQKVSHIKHAFVLTANSEQDSENGYETRTILATVINNKLKYIELNGYVDNSEVVNFDMAKYESGEEDYLDLEVEALLFEKLNQLLLSEAIKDF